MSQTLNDIRRMLSRHGLKPKHRWGQNFLHDQNHMQRIVEAAGRSAGEMVLEVGAGTGSLTERLLESGAYVVAVEIDADLEPILRERLDSFGERVALHIGDVMADKRHLADEVRTLLAQTATHAASNAPATTNEALPIADRRLPIGDSRPPPASHESPMAGGRRPTAHSQRPAFKLIANLPYNVASPLFSTLALDHPEMGRAVVMVQREVADRLTAGPGSKQYGPLGILVQAMGEVRHVASLPPECFWPRPKVSSALVRFDRRAAPLTDDPQALANLVHRLFSKRRKQIGSILGRDTKLPEGVVPAMRPEQLSVSQLATLAATMSVTNDPTEDAR